MSRKANTKNEIQALAQAEPRKKVIGQQLHISKAMDHFMKEYMCATPTEKMLAERIASAWVELAGYREVFNVWMASAERRSSPINGKDLDALSRHIDRTHRQMLATITTLRQLKQPQLQVNVIAKNAFVAQNQQINEVQ